MIALKSIEQLNERDKKTLEVMLKLYKTDDKRYHSQTSDYMAVIQNMLLPVKAEAVKMAMAMLAVPEEEHKQQYKLCMSQWQKVLDIAINSLTFINVDHFIQFIAEMTVYQITVVDCKAVANSGK